MNTLRGAWRAVTWWLKGVLGEDAYQRYLEYHRHTNCGGPVLSEREFWRARSDRLDRDGESRCC